MPTYRFFLTLATFVSYLISFTDGCSCMPTHPQEHYCASDFVVLARVKREQLINGTRIYKIRIRKEYKMSEKSYVALKSGRLLTGEEESLCGARLQVGKVYAISGKVVSLQARINLCGFAERWENLTKRQRKGLKKMYRQGCFCRIKHCPSLRCPRTKDVCPWTTFKYGRSNDCLSREGICLRTAKKQCVWAKNLAQAACMKNKTMLYSPFHDDRGKKFGQ